MKKGFTGLLATVVMMTWLGAAEDAPAPKVALVLSGGGARGLTHIGVFKALEEVGCYPDLIVGTSIGAIVGAMYASGISPDQITAYARNTRWTEVFTARPYREIEFVAQKMIDLPELFRLRFDDRFNVVFPKNLLSAQGLFERLYQVTVYPDYLAGGDFNQLAIPFRAVASDIKSGRSVVLSSGNLAKAVTASSAFPILLAPVRWDSLLLVDGGITNNVPCDVARRMGADFVIAVDVGSKIMHLGDNIDPWAFFGQAMNTLAYFSDTRNLELADVLIRPDLGVISSSDFDSLEQLIEAGYEATRQQLDRLQPFCGRTRPQPAFMRTAVSRLNSSQINQIHFQGQHKTRPFVLQREMVLKEGQLWNPAHARRSIKNLYSTGLFNSVYLYPRALDSTRIDLFVEVEEDVRSHFSFGVRYDSESKARAFLAAKYSNWLGAGIDNQLYVIASDQYQRLELDSRSTRIFTSTFTGYLTLYHVAEDIPLYQQRQRVDFGRFNRSGFNLHAGVQVRRIGLTAVGVKYEQVSVAEVRGYSPLIAARSYQLGSATALILVENTDDPDLPTRGRINNIRFEHTFRRREQDAFQRLQIESTVYETYAQRHTFATHLRCGYLTGAPSYIEQFRLGGLNSLPGFHQAELWGKLLLSMGVSYRAPLTSGTYLHSLLTFGNVWDNWEHFNWQELIPAVQIGLIVPTPLGPLQLHYGIDRRSNGLLYFSFGHYF